MKRFKSLLLAAVFVIIGAKAFAVDATVTFVSGKVEVQRAGKWVSLQKGDTVSKSETISTGFQSEAKIKIMDSVMYLGPVTRVTLEELSTTNQTDNVNIYLKTGTARSQVKHVDNKHVNYQVHTAVAVASCRGTEWIIDDSNTVDCNEGIVTVGAYSEAGSDGNTNNGVLVQANQTVQVSETNAAVSAPVNTVEKAASEVLNIISSTADQESEGGAGLGGGAAFVPETETKTIVIRNTTAKVIVVVEVPAGE